MYSTEYGGYATNKKNEKKKEMKKSNDDDKSTQKHGKSSVKTNTQIL